MMDFKIWNFLELRFFLSVSIFLIFLIPPVFAQSQDFIVKEWDIPTPNSSPHDVIVGEDGRIWFTEMGSNKIGSFDPETEEFQEWTILTDSSRPHPLTEDNLVNIWFTEVGAFKMGKLDPKTLEIIEHELQSPQTHIKFVRTDSEGNLGFPNYNNNKIGVLITNQAIDPEPIIEQKNSNELSTKITIYAPPIKQVKSGINPSNMTCNHDFQLVLKMSNGNPACVKPSSIEKLVQRGWAIHVLPEYEKNEGNNSEIFTSGDLQVETMNINYFQNANGYLARPSGEGQYPAVVMIHEWWGLNENIRDMAEKLASHGYIVLAVDLYDGQVATTSEEARQLRSSFEQQYWTDNMNIASSYLEENFSPQKIGSIGWCFGGGQSLTLALNNDSMDATVIYYGQLVTDPDELSSINWPILGIFAELDQGIPPETVNEFEATLDELEIQNEIHIYPEVNHAFANPSGDRYAPEASMDAWQRTISFFEANLKK